MKHLTTLFLSVLFGLTAAIAANPQPQSYRLQKNAENKTQARQVGFDGFSYSVSIASIDALQTVSIADVPAAKLSRKAQIPSVFTSLNMEGYTANLDEVGAPALPVKVELIELPQGATAKIVIDKAEYKDINLSEEGYNAPLFPVQPPRSKGRKGAVELAYNAEAYAAQGFKAQEPVQIEYQGQLRHVRLAAMLVRPFNYNPATHTLRVYTTLNFHVEFENADLAATCKMRRIYGGTVHNKASRFTLNSKAIDREYAASQAAGTKATVFNRPVQYVIVSDPMFKQTLQPFIDWKTKFGYEFTEVYVGENGGPAKTKESIREYLKNLYDNATADKPAPDYVLFVGDLAQIPTEKYTPDSWSLDPHYSDLYLCEYTGDRFPEVHYGRMSATTVAQLEPQIEKILYMEGIGYDKASFLDTTFIIAGIDDNFGQSHLNPTINYIESLYMYDTLERHCYKYPYPSSRNATNDIVSNINNGVSIGIYTAHGDWNEWYQPNFNVSHVNGLTNKDKYPILVGNCCLTGQFDKPSCLGEALLRKKDGGAAVYIGCSNSSYFDEDVYWTIGYTSTLTANRVHTYTNTGLGANDAYYHTHGEDYTDWAVNSYEMLYFGNMAVEASYSSIKDYYWQIYHCFGDPSYMAPTHRPAPIEAEYVPVLVLGSGEYTVATQPYARVAISEGRTIYSVATANAAGEAVLDLTGVTQPGMYTFTVSAPNAIALVAEVPAAIPADKYIVVAKETLLAEEAASGEGSEAGFAPVTDFLFGRHTRLCFDLRNVGSQTVNKAKVELVLDDPYVEVIGGNIKEVENFAAGEQKHVEGLFDLKIDPYIPEGYKVNYVVRITCDDDVENISERAFKHDGRSAALAFVSCTIDDAGQAKPNGVVDGGETVRVSFVLRNTGSITAENIKVVVAISEGLCFLSNGENSVSVPVIAPGANGTVRFNLTGRDAQLLLYPYDIILKTEAWGREDTFAYATYFGGAKEDFETGGFGYVSWLNPVDDAEPWVIDNTHVYEGQYAMASGRIDDNRKSSVSLEVDMPLDDEISFWYFLSCEKVTATMGDFFNFYIDGTRMAHLTGIESAYKNLKFNVKAGTHVFKWEYAKDGSNTGGEDRVWIDNIRLPFGVKIEGAANEYAPSVGQGGFSAFKLQGVNRGRLHLMLQSDLPVTGRLYLSDVTGRRTVLAENVTGDANPRSLSFDISRLTSGLYMCVFETPDGRKQVIKFVMNN